MAKSKKSNLKSSEFSAQSSEQKTVSQTNKTPINIGEQIRNTLIYEWQNEKLLYLFLIIHFVSLYAFSFYSDGFYQGEEGAHYINMKMFWENPSVILGNWAKTGWKLLYIFPVLLGVFAFQVHRQPDERRPGHAQQQVQRMQAEPEGGKGLGEALGDTKQLFRSVRPR